MSVWDEYNARLATSRCEQRQSKINRTRDRYSRKLRESPGYATVSINGALQEAVILSRDDFDERLICGLPGEHLTPGALVDWSGVHWLITSRDAQDVIYDRAIMRACNYLLRWVNRFGEIVERWCIIDDGTKHLAGESVNRYNENGIVLGDTRISVTLTYDEETVLLDRRNRFLIDSDGSEKPLAYRLTKPLKVGGITNGQGTVSYVLSEVNTEDTDNFEYRVANFYKYFPRDSLSPSPLPSTPESGDPGSQEESGVPEVWL